MLHDRSLRKGRDRSLTIERDRVRTHDKLSKFNFPDPLCVLSCTAQLPVQSGGVQTLAVVTVEPPRSGLVKPIYRNISYSQLVTTRRPENINLATTKTPATLRSYKYHKKKQSLLKCHELSDNFHHFMV